MSRLNKAKLADFESMGLRRRVDDLGRVVIPLDYRRYAGIQPGDIFEIFVDKETRCVLLIPCEDGECD